MVRETVGSFLVLSPKDPNLQVAFWSEFHYNNTQTLNYVRMRQLRVAHCFKTFIPTVCILHTNDVRVQQLSKTNQLETVNLATYVSTECSGILWG